jgi:hypothetical protein
LSFNFNEMATKSNAILMTNFISLLRSLMSKCFYNFFKNKAVIFSFLRAFYYSSNISYSLDARASPIYLSTLTIKFL